MHPLELVSDSFIEETRTLEYTNGEYTVYCSFPLVDSKPHGDELALNANPVPNDTGIIPFFLEGVDDAGVRYVSGFEYNDVHNVDYMLVKNWDGVIAHPYTAAIIS